jgi:hypothetical protein
MRVLYCNTHQALVALCRALGPALGGSLFAWTATSGYAWPLDFHLTFYLCGLGAMGTLTLSSLLPDSVNFKLESDSRRGTGCGGSAKTTTAATAVAAATTMTMKTGTGDDADADAYEEGAAKSRAGRV